MESVDTAVVTVGIVAVVAAVVVASLEVDRSYCSIERHSLLESYTGGIDTTAASQPHSAQNRIPPLAMSSPCKIQAVARFCQ